MKHSDIILYVLYYNSITERHLLRGSSSSFVLLLFYVVFSFLLNSRFSVFWLVLMVLRKVPPGEWYSVVLAYVSPLTSCLSRTCSATGTWCRHRRCCRRRTWICRSSSWGQAGRTRHQRCSHCSEFPHQSRLFPPRSSTSPSCHLCEKRTVVLLPQWRAQQQWKLPIILTVYYL